MHVKELKWVSIDRSLIVGGTDMGILMGVNKWKSRDELIKEKLGELVVEDNDAMYWGRMAEPMVAEHIKNNLDDDYYLFNPVNTRLPVYRCRYLRAQSQIEHPHYPFIVGSPDRLVLEKNTHEVIEGIEIKTAYEWTLKKWKVSPPDYHLMQMQTYMMCTGLEEWRCCCLVGNRTYIEHVVEADHLLQDEMVEKAIEFHAELNEIIKQQAQGALEKYEQAITIKDEDKEEVCITMGKN